MRLVDTWNGHPALQDNEVPLRATLGMAGVLSEFSSVFET